MPVLPDSGLFDDHLAFVRIESRHHSQRQRELVRQQPRAQVDARQGDQEATHQDRAEALYRLGISEEVADVRLDPLSEVVIECPAARACRTAPRPWTRPCPPSWSGG